MQPMYYIELNVHKRKISHRDYPCHAVHVAINTCVTTTGATGHGPRMRDDRDGASVSGYGVYRAHQCRARSPT